MARLRPPSDAMLALLATVVALLSTLAFVHAVTKKPWTTVDAQAPTSPTATQTVSATGPGCDGPLTTVAIARTQSSLVTICADQNGDYLYRGVRLSDGAALNVAAQMTSDREFVARNEGVTYSLSTKQLVVTVGDTVVRREPVIDFQ